MVSEQRARALAQPLVDVAASVDTVAQIVARNWLSLLVLQALASAAPAAIAWGFYGMAPSHLGQVSPLARLPQIGVQFLVSTLFAYAAARIVLADRADGRRLTPWAALRMRPETAPGLVFAAFLVSAVPLSVQLFLSMGAMQELDFLALASMVVVVESVVLGFVAPTIAVAACEGKLGRPAVLRALELTRGSRWLLVSAFAIAGLSFFLVRWFAANSLTMQLMGQGMDFDRIEQVRGAAWVAVSGVYAVVYAVWAPVLFLMLRRAKEGFGPCSALDDFD